MEVLKARWESAARFSDKSQEKSKKAGAASL
jgi:hypothetical protein